MKLSRWVGNLVANTSQLIKRLSNKSCTRDTFQAGNDSMRTHIIIDILRRRRNTFKERTWRHLSKYLFLTASQRFRDATKMVTIYWKSPTTMRIWCTYSLIFPKTRNNKRNMEVKSSHTRVQANSDEANVTDIGLDNNYKNMLFQMHFPIRSKFLPNNSNQTKSLSILQYRGKCDITAFACDYIQFGKYNPKFKVWVTNIAKPHHV